MHKKIKLRAHCLKKSEIGIVSIVIILISDKDLNVIDVIMLNLLFVMK
jgi:hypothetical protein